MEQASSEDGSVSSPHEKEFTDIGNILSQRVREIEENQSSVSAANDRHGPVESGYGSKLSKRQQRSLKELNAIPTLEVWNEVLDEAGLSPDDFDTYRSNNFEITLRKTSFSPLQNHSAKRKSRKSSMYNSNMLSITNDSWMKSKSIECLSEERLTIGRRKDQLPNILTSYSEWDLAESFDDDVKDHNDVIDLYVKGNIVNLLTGWDKHEYDQVSLIKCGRNSTVHSKRRNSANKRRSESAIYLEELDNFKPRIVDVVFKASYIKFSLRQAEQEGDVSQSRFWLIELEKTLSTKFQKEAACLHEEF